MLDRIYTKCISSDLRIEQAVNVGHEMDCEIARTFQEDARINRMILRL